MILLSIPLKLFRGNKRNLQASKETDLHLRDIGPQII